MATIGPRWALDIRRHSQEVKEAYEPLLACAPKLGIEVTRDLAYGGHPRQTMDLFRPAGAGGLPIAVFVHGGAFVRGAKRVSDELYDNVAYWFARQGFLGVNLEYRLAPESPYPGGTDDVAHALAWLHGHAAQQGGDPERILLIGHSSGGTHVASYVFDPALGHAGRHVRALVLISARLRAERLLENPNAAGVAAYFGADPRLDALRSPVEHAACSNVPTFVVVAEFENPLLDVYGLEFAHLLAVARRRAPRFLQALGHNHMSIVAHFNSGDETLGRAILEFFFAQVERQRDPRHPVVS